MSKKLAEPPLLLLDACCIINLLATNRADEILACLPYKCATSRLVANGEILTIAHDAGPDSPLEREVIPSDRLETTENLHLLDLETDEEISSFVLYAMDLDDGEASVCALAVARGGLVATDDRKALRILGEAVPQVVTLQTPDLLYCWVHTMTVQEGEIRDVLRMVRYRGRFYPRRDAPRYEWWHRLDPWA